MNAETAEHKSSQNDATTAAESNASSKRILFVVTGSINAALVPFWMHWLQQNHPHITSDILLTQSAQRFVTKDALCRLVGGQVWTDDFNDPSLPLSAHMDLQERADAFAVFPATIDFT